MARKKNDISIDMGGESIGIEFGPLKLKTTNTQTDREKKLQKIALDMREIIIKQADKISYQSGVISKLKEKLANAKDIMKEMKSMMQAESIPFEKGEKEKLESEVKNIQQWLDNLTKDDKL